MTGRADLLRVAEQLADEREQARVIVTSIREKLAEVWEQPLPVGWRTVGVARELIRQASDMLERNPPVSRELAQMAVALSASIDRAAYPAVVLAQIEGEAFRALGNSHRFMAAFDSAFRAYDASDRAFGREISLTHEHAINGFARALTLSAMNRHEDALAMLANAESEFTQFNDRDRQVRCMVLRGMIQHRRGELRMALHAYEEALAASRDGDDLHTLGSCYANIGHVCCSLGDLPAAITALQRARDIIQTLEMPVELARNDWTLGRVLLQQGEFAKAMGVLRLVRERFLDFKMIEEAGLTALDLVDALVATDDRRSAIALTETAIVDFRLAGLNENALTALAYLRDLLPHHESPAQPIRYVRTYIEKLRDEPTHAFLPLPE